MTPATKGSSLRRRLLRYGAVAVGTLALVQAVRVYQDSAHTVQLVYHAPPGELHVTLRDDAEHVVRRVYFGGAERQHEVELPSGRFTAHLAGANGTAVIRPFEVREDGLIEVRWWDR